MEIKPISPSDIPTTKEDAIPFVVIQVVNVLIVEHFSNGRAIVPTKSICDRVAFALGTIDDEFLNIEENYSQAGWNVTHHKFGNNSYYKFTENK